MTRTFSGTKKPVKRNHTLDRRRGYRSPTKIDVRCPHFEDRFFRMGEADVVDDMMAVCHHTEKIDCDYRNEVIEDSLYVCNRYVKEDFNQMTPISPVPTTDKPQKIYGKYTFNRPFTLKKASIEANVFLKDPTGGLWLTDVSWDDFPAIGASSWKKEGDKIVTTANTSESRLVYTGPDADELEDYDFSVKGYVDPAINDGDWVGVVFRHIGNQYYKLDWDGGDNKYGLKLTRVNGSAKTVLYQDSSIWVSGHVYEYSVKLKGSRIECIVKNLTTNKVIASFICNDAAFPKGSFGIYTSSQQGAYFYDIFGQGGLILTPNEIPSLKQDILLEWSGEDLTGAIEDYFTSGIEQILRDAAYRGYEIDHIVYKITGKNVTESIYFDSTGKMTTEDGASKITFDTYEYDKITETTFVLDIPAGNVFKFHDQVMDVDKTLIKVEIKATSRKLRDSFYVAHQGLPFEAVNGIFDLDKTFTEDRGVQPGDILRFGYQSSLPKMDYFTGPSIDTHDKRYKVKDNRLGWHSDED